MCCKKVYYIYKYVNYICYRLNSNYEENEIDENEDDEEEDNEKTSKRVLETYIKMILNNIGKSPIEKIHKMLQVFIVGQNKCIILLLL